MLTAQELEDLYDAEQDNVALFVLNALLNFGGTPAMSLQILADELTNDPLARGYAGMTDSQARDDVNTAYRDAPAAVRVDQVRQYLTTQISGTAANQRSLIDMLREYAEDGTVRGVAGAETGPEARRSGAQMIWYMLQLEDSDVQFHCEHRSKVLDRLIKLALSRHQSEMTLSTHYPVDQLFEGQLI